MAPRGLFTMTVTWSVNSLESRNADGFVCCAHYDAVYEEERIYGAVSFDSVEDVSTVDAYVPYEELTEEVTLEWVKEALGEEEVETIETELVRRHAEKELPAMRSGLPW